MKKTTPPKKKSKIFYSIVLSAIKNYSYPTKVAKSLNISKQRLYYYTTTLQREGCIKKISQGAWIFLKDFDEKRVKKSKKINLGRSAQPPQKTMSLLNDKNVRGHAFMFHLKLGSIRNWNNRRKYFDRIKLKYEKLKHGEKIIIKGRIVHLFSKSVIIYDRESYVSELARETKSLAVYNFLSIITNLENKIKVSFKYRKKYQFRVTREHYALMKNCLAKQFNKEGKKLEVYNGKGLWLLIDNSFNLDEKEVLKNRESDPNQAIEDTNGVQNYWNSHKNTNFKVTPDFILEAMHGIQQNQGVFDQNMKSHLSVLDKLGTAVDELRKEIKRGKK